MTKKTFIYKITNKINNKLYIGKTTSKNPLNRWAKHLSTAKNKTVNNNTYQVLHKAINKYGKENFIFEIIEECDNELFGLEREKFWIKHYVSFGKNGYNLTKGGDGSSGFRHSQKSKNKMSQSRRGTRLGEENSFYGKHHSTQTKKLLSNIHKGKKIPKNQIMKRSKLTIKEVLQIRKECDDCITKKSRTLKYKELAKKYQVSIGLLRLIFNRERWADI